MHARHACGAPAGIWPKVPRCTHGMSVTGLHSRAQGSRLLLQAASCMALQGSRRPSGGGSKCCGAGVHPLCRHGGVVGRGSEETGLYRPACMSRPSEVPKGCL